MASVTKFRIEMVCESAAFDNALSAETARILRALADRIESEFSGDLREEWTARDANGNRCGKASFYIGRA